MWPSFAPRMQLKKEVVSGKVWLGRAAEPASGQKSHPSARQSWQCYGEQRPECARLEGPSEAASWGTGTHKRVGEVHGDQTAESRNENRLGPKGQQLQLCKHQTSGGGFRCRSGDPAELSRRMGPPQSSPSVMMTLS